MTDATDGVWLSLMERARSAETDSQGLSLSEEGSDDAGPGLGGGDGESNGSGPERGGEGLDGARNDEHGPWRPLVRLLGTIEPPSKPMLVAEELVETWRSRYRGPYTLRYWRDGWIRWVGTHWAPLAEDELTANLYTALMHTQYVARDGEVVDWAPRQSSVRDLLAALKATLILPEAVEPGEWLGAGGSGSGSGSGGRGDGGTEGGEGDGRPAGLVGPLVACRNGLLDAGRRVGAGGQRVLYPHDPAYLNTVAVPYAWEEGVGAPVEWLRFLDSVWGRDQESVALLQEWFGYVLSGRTDLQKILLMVGASRSGKGTIARVLTALVGRGHVAGPTLSSLATDFGLESMIGRSLAVLSDARAPSRGNEVVVERLLSISGEDTLTVARKYRQAWIGRLGARLMILSNEPLDLGDHSDALNNRLVTLTFTRSFQGQEDGGLEGRLLQELPGILKWGLEGLDRLRASGRFGTPEASRDLAELMRDLGSPVAVFLKEECEVGEEHSVLTQELYHAYVRWCQLNGVREASDRRFGKDLWTTVPNRRKGKASTHPVTGERYHASKRPNVYLGVRLRPDSDLWPDWVVGRQ